jgi:two-component system, chemotaxis family, sensor histidine kinase and response regulator PixL
MSNPIDPEKICADFLQGAQGMLYVVGGEVLHWLGVQQPMNANEPQPMNSNLDAEQIHADFLNEAQELLQIIEQELLNLRAEKTPAKVHNLMRAAHTLKGSSASVGLNNLSQIAHGLEGIFKSLYNPDLVIDKELDTLMFQAYEYLRLAVTETTTPEGKNDPDVLNRAASILAEVQIKLGDNFNPDAAIPSSVELGFDVVGSIFEVGVKQRLEELQTVLSEGDAIAVAQTLQNCNEIFIGLAESLNLPGFGAIARITEQALQIYPDRTLEIAEIALFDLQAAHQAVMEGDRTRGGEPSARLQAIATRADSPEPILSPVEAEPPLLPLEIEIADENGLEVEALPEEDSAAVEFDRLEEEEIEPTFSEIDFLPPAELESAAPETNGFIPYEDEPFDLQESDSLAHPTLDQVFGNFDPAMLPEFAPVSGEAEDEAAEENEIEPAIADSTSQTETTAEDFDESLSEDESEDEDDEPTEIAVPTPAKSATPEKSPTPILQTVRVDLKRLERLNFQAGELLIDQNRQIVHNEHLIAALQELRSRLEKHQQTLSRLRTWELSTGEPTGNWQLKRADGEDMASPNPIAKLDALEFDRYSELHVLLQSATEEMVQMEEAIEVFDLYARQSGQILEKQQRLLKSVRDDLTQARMQQLGEILARIERVLQQLTSVYHKSIEFKITGSQVLVDKAIAQQLYDPLLHLVRNAFAHGIEAPEVRREWGKPAQGKIDIRAYTQGNRTFIEVSDDGRGIDFERIRERAVELDRVAPGEAEMLSDEELLEFIFQPGFSTAREANDLFGRGVGLDVVRSNLEALNATVAVTSQWQVGTTFSIRLPLTLSVAKLLVCQAGSLAYAVSSDNIEQIVLLRSHQVKRLGSQRVIQWQQPPSQHNHGTTGVIHTVPIHRLSDLLAYHSPLVSAPSSDSLPALVPELARADLPMVMLLRAQGGLLGIEVDRVLGEQELVIRPLGSAIAPPNYVDGCSILGNSRLALVIDPVALVERILSKVESPLVVEMPPRHLPASLPALPRPVAMLTAKSPNGHRPSEPIAAPIEERPFAPSSLPKAPRPGSETGETQKSRKTPPLAPHQVLVVDDSITLRQNLTRTLERSGYRVLQARDGLEALEQLQRHKEISLIICDLEMPNMNGLEFLNAYRRNPRVSHIPVVILTSRQGEKHRQLALGLGASAYLTKPYLEHELLRTVTKYVAPQNAIA